MPLWPHRRWFFTRSFPLSRPCSERDVEPVMPGGFLLFTPAAAATPATAPAAPAAVLVADGGEGGRGGGGTTDACWEEAFVS